MRELCAENRFYVQSLKIKSACTVCAQWICLITIQQGDDFLGYLAVFFFFFLHVNPFVSYGCFYRTRSIVRNC